MCALDLKGGFTHDKGGDMKRWQPLLAGFAVCLLGISLVGSAQAFSVSGRSSTEVEWYDNAQGDTALPAYQYLLLNVRDLGVDGLNFRGYGRLSTDINDEVDAKSRLYYAYLEKRDVVKNLNVKIGRQFISTTAGASLMDGLYLDYNNLGPLKLSLFGGGDVAYYSNYDAKDLIGGAKISGVFFDKSLHLGLSYLQRWSESELANEMYGLDVDYDFRDQLNLYSEVQFDYLSDSVSYFLAGGNYHPAEQWGLRIEYLYSLPVFSSTSIYSVFAVSEYEEIMAEVSYRLSNGLRTFGRYQLEMYEDFENANVFEAGVEKIRTDRFSGYLSGVWRDDSDGQDLRGFKARGAYLFNKYLQAGVGVEVDVLERRLETESDDTTSSRYWLDTVAYLTKKINVMAKVERVESALWDDYYRGRVRLNILF
jgi:hypothetical protein